RQEEADREHDDKRQHLDHFLDETGRDDRRQRTFGGDDYRAQQGVEPERGQRDKDHERERHLLAAPQIDEEQVAERNQPGQAPEEAFLAFDRGEQQQRGAEHREGHAGPQKRTAAQLAERGQERQQIGAGNVAGFGIAALE